MGRPGIASPASGYTCRTVSAPLAASAACCPFQKDCSGAEKARLRGQSRLGCLCPRQGASASDGVLCPLQACLNPLGRTFKVVTNRVRARPTAFWHLVIDYVL